MLKFTEMQSIFDYLKEFVVFIKNEKKTDTIRKSLQHDIEINSVIYIKLPVACRKFFRVVNNEVICVLNSFQKCLNNNLVPNNVHVIYRF